MRKLGIRLALIDGNDTMTNKTATECWEHFKRGAR